MLVNNMTYLIIFLLKILENTLGTLRLIIVSNGKKLEGAILNFLLAIVWVISTSMVVINNDIFKIFVFALGSLIGSYVGSIIEEKIALGNNMLLVISKKYEQMKNSITDYDSYIVNENILMIMVSRKKRKAVINIILNIDHNAKIFSESIKQLVFK